MIIKEVVLHSYASPPKPTDLHGQRRRELSKEITGIYDEARRVRFPAGPASNPALSLLLVNHKMYDETLEAVKHISIATPITYTADIIYLKEVTLWPTWLSVPMRASHIDTLYAQFRIFDCPAGKEMPQPAVYKRLFLPGPNDDDNNPPQALIWPFYHVLIGSLLSGSPCGNPVSINRLVLNFLPDMSSMETLLQVHPSILQQAHGLCLLRQDWVVPFCCPERKPPLFGNVDPLGGGGDGDGDGHDDYRQYLRRIATEWLMVYVLDQLEEMARLRMENVELGKIIFENIGFIDVQLDGLCFVKIDLAQALEVAHSRKQDDDQSERWARKFPVEFARWKRKVEARRQSLGMPGEGEWVKRWGGEP